MARQVVNVEGWTVEHRPDPQAAPSIRVPARVPGAVQLDWAAAHGWPEYWKGKNSLEYGWMEDVWWTYRATLPPVQAGADEAVFLVLGGVDYHCDVVLNGRVALTHEGMFTPIELGLTGQCTQPIELEVRLRPAPKRAGAPRSRAEADTAVKPAVSYGWDWHPRLIPLGIWQEAFLEVRPKCHIRWAEALAVLSEDNQSALVSCRGELSGAAPLRWRLLDPSGQCIHEDTGLLDALRPTRIERPDLWWPHDHGDQPLYKSVVELLDERGVTGDAATHRFGIRRAELVMAPGQWNEPAGWPKSRSHPPMTLRINGRDLFARGTNWVNPEIFPGIITADTYRPLLELARDAHFNLLRVWGGGIVNKESFHEQCDELGIMVWQEFPLACNDYDPRRRPEYLTVLEQEARAIVQRLRRHPSTVIWCGGNELFNVWSGMTDQSLALRLLDKVCYEEDQSTPFLPTSPVDGVGHGCYLFDEARYGEPYQWMNAACCTAYTEFGVPGASPSEVLETFIGNDELWPPREGTAWEHHHAFGAWMRHPVNTWLCPETLEKYFGPSPTLEQLIERSQWLQCEGYKAIFEEARRQKPRCSMALNWCFNEPWPTASNNSLVNWPARPKPSFHAVRDACRPVMASARLERFAWSPGDRFAPQLWVLNDTCGPVEGGQVEVTLAIGGEVHRLLAWDFAALPANTHLCGPTLHCVLPESSAQEMTLRLTVCGRESMGSAYRLRYRGRAVGAAPGQRLMNL